MAIFFVFLIAFRSECYRNLPIETPILHSKKYAAICDFFSFGNDPLAIAYSNTSDFTAKIRNSKICNCPLFKAVFDQMTPTTGKLEENGYFTFDATSVLHDLLSLHATNSSDAIVRRSINLGSLSNVQKFVRKSLTPIIRNYIGQHVVQGISNLLELGARNIKKSEYVSGMWHHDRCAKRIKCFFFITDVDDQSHPMRLISKSHKQIYFDYTSVSTSRFTREYALKHGIEVVFTGSAGHGFCFDTNAIHQGTLKGHKKRITLIIEFHDAFLEKTYKILNVHAPFGQ